MQAVQVLRNEAEMAYADLRELLDGVSEKKSWAVIPGCGDDNEYLHTDGTIHGIILHIATCKMMYASLAFRKGEIRWRDCAERLDAFEPSWDAALAYLDEAQHYWMNSWQSLEDADLEREVLHFSGKQWPTWKIIRMQNYHDAYHGGQIAVLRYAVRETDTYPPSSAEDIRKYCASLPNW